MNELDDILNRYANNEKTTGSFSDYSLDGIRMLLDALDNPERDIPIIHVAGTNGKGSTCHMIESIYRTHGYRTGLYTSPHLERVNERIRLDSREITDDDFLSSVIEVDHCASSIKSLQMTYFDILTATALLYFKRNNTDMVILETGMGGRLDSTNVITPVAVVITPVDYDHMYILGETLAKIAAEKAGIIKKETPVITTNRNADVIDVLSRKAARENAPLRIIDRDFTASHIETRDDGVSYSFRNGDVSFDNIQIKHPGQFQCENSAAAIQCAIESGLEADETLIRKSFSSLILPGRMETLCESPVIVFDPAHNEQAIRSLSDMIKSQYHDITPAVFITLMKDKTPERMIELIRATISDDIYYITINDQRAYVPPDINTFSGVFPASDQTLHTIAESAGKDEVFLFTGSFRIHHFASRLAGFFVDRSHINNITID
ncbi:MAG TPA: folylpolyglutamate synthase/dihydrofolate synthase family protein [Spirochaetota bacterium]|nr:folylpolyglutamate synthase/dihydrofolate synthase family protein [Spirochaetota bacterium]